MAQIFKTDIDLSQNQLKNASLEARTSSPASPKIGQVWYRTDDSTNVITGRGIMQTSSGEKKLAFIDDITASVNSYIPLSQKGVANGVATLDSNGQVPSAQLPGFVDDVLEFASRSNFPGTGEAGKIYIAKDTNKSWRWTGSTYAELSSGAVIGTGTPSQVSTSASQGSSAAAAPFDHVHSIGSRVVSGSNIQLSTIASENLADSSVTNAKIYNATITGSKIATSTVINSNLATMPALTVKMNNSSSSDNPQDVSLSNLATLLASNTIELCTVKAFSNPALTPSGGQCTWQITGALSATKKRLGYYVPIIQIWQVGSVNIPVEMATQIDNSTGNITIYFNASSSVSANTYIARISE